MNNNKERHNMFPQAPLVKASINYDLFKRIHWNRSVDKGNFQKLLKENREHFQLHRFPILVTKDFKIIDGQHRFEVAKELGSPIYYIQDEVDDSFKTVHSVNKAGKKHTLRDKIEMLERAGDEGAKMIYKVFQLYQGTFDLTTIACLLVAGIGGGNINESIDTKGTIPLNNYDHGIEVLDAMFYSSIPHKGKSRIVFALAALSKKNGVHPKAIVKRVTANLIKWIDPKSCQEAQRVMANCYNYGLTVKNRVKSEKV
jgi:hypothetical protein